MKRLKQSLALFVITLLPLMTYATTKEYTLDNGLKLIVRQDSRAPVVVSMVWYKVGSAHEPLGLTGVSHVLEHMMFKGTKNVGSGEFSREIALRGGEENAFTYFDFTGYYQELSADDLAFSFEMEADRMQNLLLDEEEFKSELEVVKEERRLRTEDNPQMATLERFYAAAYIGYPYHNPVIGWMNDLDNMTIDDIRDWYKTWYAPNNAIVVVVGDVQPNAVYELAKKTFGQLAPSTLPEQKTPREPAYLGDKRIKVELPAQTPWLIFGYNVPVFNTVEIDWEPYALDVLTTILANGRSSRFSTNLIRGQEIASSASGSYSPASLYSNILYFYGTPTQGKTINELENAMMNEIKTLQETLVDKKELQRVKTQAIAQNIYGKDSNMGQANEIGILESIGQSWEIGEDYVEKLQAVTAEQVQAVAKKYLVPQRLTVAELVPQTIGEKTNVE